MKSKLFIFALATMLTSCGNGKSPSDLIKKVFGGEPTEQTEEVATETTEVGTASGEFDRHDAKKLKVIKVEYNNSLAPQAGNTYEAKNLIDGKSQTAWAVSLDKAGFDEDKLYGPIFTINCKKLTHIIIQNGYGKSADAFQNNTRAAKIQFMKLADEDNEEGEFDTVLFEGPLADTSEPQILEIPLDMKENNDIKQVWMIFGTPQNGGFYKGKKWNDLCISEVEFWGFE